MPSKKGKGAKKKERENQPKREKVKVDPTFGMKNKKGRKNRQFIQNARNNMNQEEETRRRKNEEKKRAKEAARRQKEEMASLFRTVEQAENEQRSRKEQKGIFCEMFKQGLCTRGKRCPFSHDRRLLNRQTTKKKGPHNNWTTEELEQMVAQNLNTKGNKPRSKKICEHFLTAIEKRVFGHFWRCPDGDECIYRHELPPGFRLKTDEEIAEEKEANRPRDDVEEELDRMRTEISGRDDLTPVTPETFAVWHAKWTAEKEAAKAEKAARKKKKKKKKTGLSGRDLFVFDPTLFQDDDAAAEEYIRERDEVQDEKDYVPTADDAPPPAPSSNPDAPPTETIPEETAADVANIENEDLFLDDDMLLID